MTTAAQLIEKYRELVGQEIHLGPWLEIDQQRIDDFAAVTGDQQWIHVDPERAASESPYGTTIAHGFLTLSLLPYLTQSNHPDFFATNYPGMRLRINYGLNRVRYPEPVLCGDRIRARTAVHAVDEVSQGVQVVYRMTVEIQGRQKPACVAEQVMRVYP
ncbi:MAG: MaoC family dehydratase [Desulfuromonadales bacterium]